MPEDEALWTFLALAAFPGCCLGSAGSVGEGPGRRWRTGSMEHEFVSGHCFHHTGPFVWHTFFSLRMFSVHTFTDLRLCACWGVSTCFQTRFNRAPNARTRWNNPVAPQTGARHCRTQAVQFRASVCPHPVVACLPASTAVSRSPRLRGSGGGAPCCGGQSSKSRVYRDGSVAAGKVDKGVKERRRLVCIRPDPSVTVVPSFCSVGLPSEFFSIEVEFGLYATCSLCFIKQWPQCYTYLLLHVLRDYQSDIILLHVLYSDSLHLDIFNTPFLSHTAQTSVLNAAVCV